MKFLTFPFIILAMLISTSAITMERPPQPPEPIRTTLVSLPTELKIKILCMNDKADGIISMDTLAKGILSFAGTNRAFRETINSPENILVLLKSLPKKTLAISLASKLGRMPSIQSKQVMNWLYNDIQLKNGIELFCAAYKNSDLKSVDDLLNDQDLNLNWKNKEGWTTLMAASCDGCLETVNRLLAAGAHVNAESLGGNTALTVAIHNRHAKIAIRLLACGATTNTQNATGDTALIYACARGYTEIVTHLLAAGANPKLRNIYGKSARDTAVLRGYAEIVKLIDDANAARKAKQASASNGCIIT